MFNIKALLLLLVSLGFGGGASIYAKNWLEAQQGIVSETETAEMVEVVVAAREIPYGQVLEATHLRTVGWPADSVPDGVYLNKEKLVGMVIKQAALPGDLMLEGRVGEKLEGSNLSALISPNKRAITVRVDDVNGVAGFLLPGNHVDVLATRLENRRAKTRTLLQDIKVLAIDQSAARDENDPVVVRAVTLEANLDEAAKLTGATAEGTIQLVLRNPDDRALEIAVEEKPKPVVKPASVRKPVDTSREITIIRGTSVDRTKVKL